MLPLPHIRLRALEPEDLDLLYAIENASDVRAISQHTALLSRHSLRHFLANTTYDIHTDGYIRLVAINEADSPVGLVDLTDYAPRDSRAELGIALLPTMRGKGYARAAIAALCHYAKETLALRLLTATTLASNAKAHRLLLDCHFKQVATLPQWYIRTQATEDGRVYTKFL